MTIQLFITLLFAYSVITSLIVECIKKILSDKDQLPNNILALVVALVVGIGGTLIYYQLNGVALTSNNVIFMILLGLFSCLCAELGYDKVIQAINQITQKQIQ